MRDGRLLEIEAADFGLLFPCFDAFIVHGGLTLTLALTLTLTLTLTLALTLTLTLTLALALTLTLTLTLPRCRPGRWRRCSSGPCPTSPRWSRR